MNTIFLSIYLLFLWGENKKVLANESMNVSITSRILGGEDADMRLHSHTLALHNRDGFLCTAFAMSEEDVFTCAHCFALSGMSPPYLGATVHSGINSGRGGGNIHEIERVTVHPQFDPERSMIHDMAHILLKEGSKLRLGLSQRQLDVPTREPDSGELGLVTGWGCTDLNNIDPAERLQKLEMRIMNYTDCQPYMAKTLYKEQLCAYHSQGHGCSPGDSGGPLVIDNEAIGIHSWCPENECGNGAAEVFTNVFQEKLFLKSVMRNYPATESTSSSSSDDPPPPKRKGKQIQGESSSKKKKTNWIRKLTCTDSAVLP